MEKVTAQALGPDFTFTRGPEALRIEKTQDTLKIYVRGELAEPECLVTFTYPLGFRVVDERDLMEYWPVCSTPNGWIFLILSGGWLDQERKRPGSLMLDTYPDVSEYLITSLFDCVSVFSCDEPLLTPL